MRAFHGMMSGDMETHDKIMLELAGTIKNKDVIVFAQGSLEHLAGEITKITSIPVVTAPALLVEDIKRVIGN
jgi:phosphoribosylcarboxyaminoimidazole (NCAIR) mutase